MANSLTWAPARPEPTRPSTGSWPLVFLALGQLLVVLDDTVVNLALPAASHALSIDPAQRQWVITGYAAAFAAVLPLGGALADRAGARRMIVLGAAGFAVASGLGAAAWTPSLLFVARVLQGVAAGLLGPAVLGGLSRTYPGGTARARAFAVYAATSASGAVIGLLLGGALAEVSWRWSLLVSALVAVPVIFGAHLVPGTSGRGSPVRPGGAVLALCGLLLLVAGLSTGEWTGWGSGAVLAGAVLVTIFLMTQHRAAEPMVDLSLLRGSRGAALIALLMGYCGMFAVFLFLTFILQGQLGLTPLRTGAAYLPMTGAIGLSSALAVTYAPRVGVRLLVPGGMVVAAAGLVWLAHLGPGSTYVADVLAPTVVLGAGLGTVFSTATAVATAVSSPSEATGASAALVNIAQQLGVALGTALLSGIATLAARTGGVDVLAGPHAAFWAGAAIFLAGAVATVVLLRDAPRRPSGHGPGATR